MLVNTWPYIGVINAVNMGMKDLPKKLLPLTLFGIAVTSLFCVQPAQGFTMTLQQVGSNVVANGSGAFNLSGLTGAGNLDGGPSGVRAIIGFIGIHPVGVSYPRTLDSPDRRVSGAARTCSWPTLAQRKLCGH